MKKISNQYLAGFFDGESYFGIYRIKKNNKKQWDSKRNILYRAVIEVANTNKEVIDEIHKIFGGYLKIVEPINRDRKRTLYVNRCDNGIQVGKIIKKIYPYLIVKRKHADILLKFLKTFNEKTGRELPEKIFNNREVLHKELSLLNIKRRVSKV
jgi:hypothetical protein